MDFRQMNESMPAPDAEAMEAARRHWDTVAKPLGSLGLLEDAVVKLAGLTGGDLDISKRAVLVLCADNGVLAEGVAMTPGAVTAVMAGFIAAGRSSVCAMARVAKADVIAVDMGMATRVDAPGLLNRRLGDGTANMAKGPAMSRAQAEQGIQTGIDLVRDCKEKGYKLLLTGEMGIGNTTTSSAVASVLLGRAPAEMTGRGVGLSDAGLEAKVGAITRAIEANRPAAADALDVLAKVGGFDIAAMCGVFIGGGLYRVPVVVDGFISGVSALVASRLCPACAAAMLPSHLSKEPAAGYVLEGLGLRPVICADMRLGEGTGAVASLPLLDMALAVYNDVMTYADIGMG